MARPNAAPDTMTAMVRAFLRLVVVVGFCFLSLRGWADGAPSAEGVDRQIRAAQDLLEKGKADDAWTMYESLRGTLAAQPLSSQLGFVLNEMSKIASGRGNYDQARALAREAAEIYRKVGDQKGESHAVNIEGLVEVDQGNYGVAEERFATALALSRAVRDVDNEVQVLNNLGSAYFFEGKYLEAMRSYEAAKQSVDRIELDKEKSYWGQVTDFNQATLYQRLGRYEIALTIYKQVEASSSTMTSSDRAHVEANLGTLYRRLGDPWKALESYRRAQTLYARDRDADGELGVLKNIGILYALELKDLARARGIFAGVLQLASRNRNRREEMQAHLYLAETLLLMKAPGRAQEAFGKARQLANQLGTPEEEWKSLYGLGQCEEALGNNGAAEAHYRAAIEIIERTRAQLQLSALRAEFLGDKRNAYDALIALLLRRNETEGAFIYLERSRARNFQDRVASAPETAQLTLDEVRKRLAPGTALLEYWTAGDQLAAIWCSRERTQVLFTRVLAEKRKSILEGIAQLSGASGEWRPSAALLADLVPSKWLEEEPNVRHLLIVPDGWLARVPFELVPTRPGELLIERLDVAQMPSASLLRRAAPKSKVRPPWVTQLVAFGNPVIRRWTPSVGLANALEEQQPADLPFSAQEVRDVAALVPGNSVLYLGKQNRKAVFLGGGANRAPLLHVSTHAFADESNPENSRLLFSSDDASGSDDEFVFLRQLYGMDLRNVSLAVLSACDTERGKIVRGEGAQTFSRALLAAGSQSVITTLWKVDDRATAEFMKQFYYFAMEGSESRSDALRQAKLKFLRSHSAAEHPKYWAAFVLHGEALTPLPRAVGWQTIVLAALGPGAGVVVFLVWLARRRRVDGQHDA